MIKVGMLRPYVLSGIILCLRRVDPNSQYILCTIFFANKKRLILTKSENKIKFGGHGPFKEVRDHFSKWPKRAKNMKIKLKNCKINYLKYIF